MSWKEERLTWDEKHMLAAITIASRSSCEVLHTGAVVIKNKRVIAEGYNGAPEGIENCLNNGCRKRKHGVDFETKGTGNCIALHAEINALSEVSKERAHGAALYTVYYPCADCAKEIVNSGIQEIVYLKEYREPSVLAKELFEARNIKVRKLELNLERCFRVLEKTGNAEIYGI
jgi:dCMP deaminase